jgi:hypothetical protein
VLKIGKHARAICPEDAHLGCPYPEQCEGGRFDPVRRKTFKGTIQVVCMNCDRPAAIVSIGNRSAIGFCGYYPKAQPHPRREMKVTSSEPALQSA